MTDSEYQTLQAGDAIELIIDGSLETGTATGKKINGMPEIDWNKTPGKKGLILSNLFLDQAKIVRKGRML